jgi:hypothetical protein
MVLAHQAAETFVAETAEPLVRLVPHRGKATTRRSAVPATRIDKGSTVARRRGPRAWLHWRDGDLCPCRKERRELETALGTHDADQNSASWNQVAGWLRHLGDLRAHSLSTC